MVGAILALPVPHERHDDGYRNPNWAVSLRWLDCRPAVLGDTAHPGGNQAGRDDLGRAHPRRQDDPTLAFKAIPVVFSRGNLPGYWSSSTAHDRTWIT